MKLSAVTAKSVLLLVAILAFSPPFCDGVREEANVKKKSKGPTIDKSTKLSNALHVVNKISGKREKQKLHFQEAISKQIVSSPVPSTPKMSEQTWAPYSPLTSTSSEHTPMPPTKTVRTLLAPNSTPTTPEKVWLQPNSTQTTHHHGWMPSNPLDQAWLPSSSQPTVSDQQRLLPSSLKSAFSDHASMSIPLATTLSDQARIPSQSVPLRSAKCQLQPHRALELAPLQLHTAIPTSDWLRKLSQIRQAKVLHAQQQLAAKFEKMNTDFLAKYGELPKFSGQPKTLLGVPAHLQQQYKSHPYIAKLLEYQQPAQPKDIFMQNLPKMPSVPQNDQFPMPYDCQAQVMQSECQTQPNFTAKAMSFAYQPKFTAQAIQFEYQTQAMPSEHQPTFKAQEMSYEHQPTFTAQAMPFEYQTQAMPSEHQNQPTFTAQAMPFEYQTQAMPSEHQPTFKAQEMSYEHQPKFTAQAMPPEHQPTFTAQAMPFERQTQAMQSEHQPTFTAQALPFEHQTQGGQTEYQNQPTFTAQAMPFEHRTQTTFIKQANLIRYQSQPAENCNSSSPPPVFWHYESDNDLNGIFAP
ncbi:hypothetical protein niasHS_007730 [Heterodera schachtii]|uniref:Gland protein n=1 Tax=Heterodera schachtii TaxID=97005 RepID=A0ABD2JPH6_HETSC